MRIGIACFGHGLGQTGGVQVYLRELVAALAEHDAAGHEYVLLARPGEEPPRVASAPRFTLARVADRGFDDGPVFRRALRLAAGSAPEIDGLGLDLVHYPATRVLHPVRRTPLALTFFDMQEEFLPGFFTRRERLARALLHRDGVRRAAVVIAPSRFTAECLGRRYGTPARKIVHVPVGVGARFEAAPGPEERASLARLGLEPGSFALYPANPWPHKNHERLMRALGRLARLPGGAPRLVCAGRLEGVARTAAGLARAAGLPGERVLDLGFVPAQRLPALYRAARLLVFPSLFEGFGLPVLEALAAGCPVACSDLEPLREIAGEAARYFDPRDEAAMADAVAELWTDERRRAELEERGRARALAFRWERIVPRLVAAYALAAAAR